MVSMLVVILLAKLENSLGKYDFKFIDVRVLHG